MLIKGTRRCVKLLLLQSALFPDCCCSCDVYYAPRFKFRSIRSDEDGCDFLCLRPYCTLLTPSLIQLLVQMSGFNDSKGILDFIGVGKESPSGGRSQGASRLSSSEHSPIIPCHPDKGPRHECARCRSVDHGGDLRLPKRTGSSGQHLDLAAVVHELQTVRERHRVLEALVMKVMADVQTVLVRVDGQPFQREGHDVVGFGALRPSIVRNSQQEDRREMQAPPPPKALGLLENRKRKSASHGVSL